MVNLWINLSLMHALLYGPFITVIRSGQGDAWGGDMAPGGIRDPPLFLGGLSSNYLGR